MLLSPRDKQVAVLCEEIFKLPAIFQCLKLIEKQIWFDVFTERMGSTMVMINIALVVCCPSKPIQDLEKNISYLLRPEFKRIFEFKLDMENWKIAKLSVSIHALPISKRWNYWSIPKLQLCGRCKFWEWMIQLTFYFAFSHFYIPGYMLVNMPIVGYYALFTRITSK